MSAVGDLFELALPRFFALLHQIYAVRERGQDAGSRRFERERLALEVDGVRAVLLQDVHCEKTNSDQQYKNNVYETSSSRPTHVFR